MSVSHSIRLGGSFVDLKRRGTLSLHHPDMLPNTRCSVSKCFALSQARFLSTNPHFYQNRQLELFATREAKRLSLRQLVHGLSYRRDNHVRIYAPSGLFWKIYE
jgi:hypothetical protein